MKSLFFILLALGFYVLGHPQVEEVYYETGQLKSATPINNDGMFDGIAHAYYQNGEVAMETPYVRGVRHGLERAYYANGNLKAECEYQNDLLHGTYTAYFRNGEVKAVQNWEFGLRGGDFYAYYPNGDLRMYALMSADSLLFAQHFDEYGMLIAERLYHIVEPIDTSVIYAPRIYLPEGERFLNNQPNEVHICLPRIPSKFISYASPSGVIRRGHSELYSLILQPDKQVEEFILYLRIKTHSSAQPSLLRSIRIPIE